jgi:tetratricopeptide (TPR) repeat protein
MLAMSVVLADGVNSNEEEMLINKAKDKAEKIKTDDWKALADCARLLIDQRIQYDEALTWLEKSVSINENHYNLTILGDYYRLKLDYTKAYEHYLNAILSAQKERKMDVIPDIQWKVLVTMGTKNYYDYMEKQYNNN